MRSQEAEGRNAKGAWRIGTAWTGLDWTDSTEIHLGSFQLRY